MDSHVEYINEVKKISNPIEKRGKDPKDFLLKRISKRLIIIWKDAALFHSSKKCKLETHNHEMLGRVWRNESSLYTADGCIHWKNCLALSTIANDKHNLCPSYSNFKVYIPIELCMSVWDTCFHWHMSYRVVLSVIISHLEIKCIEYPVSV